MKKTIFAVILVLGFFVFLILFARNASAPSNENKNASNNPSNSTPDFDEQAYPLDQPGSLWWIVNKTRPINPIAYAPTDLSVPNIPLRSGSGNSESRTRNEVTSALENMTATASKANAKLMLVSGYRSYTLQVSVYNSYVLKYGQSGADKVSARPGTSEHQTGLAVDVGAVSRECELDICFANTVEGKWLVDNAYKFGFIIRYPEAKYEITGYDFEPWHLRYVGIDLATEMHNQNIQTLEEFFNAIPDKQPY